MAWGWEENNNEVGEASILLNPPPVSFLRNIRISDLIARVSGSAAVCATHSCIPRTNKNSYYLFSNTSLSSCCWSVCLQKWFKLRNAQWRQAEGLPAELGSVLDWRICCLPLSWSKWVQHPCLMQSPSPCVDLHFCIYEAILADCSKCESFFFLFLPI